MSSHFDTGPLRATLRDNRELQQIEDGLRQMDYKQTAMSVARLRAAGDELEGTVLYFKWIRLQGRA